MNWKSAINDMLARGETITTIARATGVTSANIRALTINEDQQPRWSTGEKIRALHKRVMRRYPKIDTRA